MVTLFSTVMITRTMKAAQKRDIQSILEKKAEQYLQ